VTESDINPDAVSLYAPKDLNIGDSVRILSINQDASVLTKPDSKGDLMVQVGLMKMNVNLKGLNLIPRKKQDQLLYEKVQNFKSASADINIEKDVRGYNIEEAIMEIDQYLDSATIANLHHVRIIHGKGTGVLRKGLHEHFKRHPHVKSFELAPLNEGGSGATVIQLK
jgi:DNA mismatch repair protein MutS2